MARRWRRTVALCASAILMPVACSRSDSPVEVPVNPGTASAPTVTPAIAAAAPNVTVSFTATDSVGAVSVTWRVNGINGGSAALGTISSAGQYHAPAVIPDGDSVVVTATRTADTTKKNSATIFFVPSLTANDYYVPIPRVVDATNPRPTRYLLVPPPTATTVTFLSRDGTQQPLASIGNGVLSLVVDGAFAVANHQAGMLHRYIGGLDYRSASGTQVKLTNLNVNIRDAAMPDVPITQLAADAQRGKYVLNLRMDTVTINGSAKFVSRALQVLGGDLFDFVAVIATVTTNNNRSYQSVRNEIQGIGTTVFDNSASWGGAGKLRGMINYPIDGYFDGAEAAFMHEHGHAWINFAKDAVLSAGRPHWPPSTMANGVMGWSLPPSSQGGTFPWALTSLGNGTVRINQATPSDHYTPLDLYMMGLLPPDSVPPAYILPSTPSPNTYTDGMISSATTYTIADFIAANGVRVPASTSSQRAFSTAVVVLTYGRLLTPSEMAFFDAASARAETTVMLRAITGFATVDTSGFYLATDGRATIKTRLQ